MKAKGKQEFATFYENKVQYVPVVKKIKLVLPFWTHFIQKTILNWKLSFAVQYIYQLIAESLGLS